MFIGCYLSKESVINILDSLPTWPSGTASDHPITIGANAAECLEQIAQTGEVKYRRDADILQKVFEATNTKNWSVADIYYGENYAQIPDSEIEPLPTEL